jgi:hypothetical protein
MGDGRAGPVPGGYGCCVLAVGLFARLVGRKEVMKKALRPTTGNAIGKNEKQAGNGADGMIRQNTRLTRPVTVMDINDLPNREPIIGKQNPRHVNFMFEFGKQSLRGTVGYGPYGKPEPGRFTDETVRTIIKNLGET